MLRVRDVRLVGSFSATVNLRDRYGYGTESLHCKSLWSVLISVHAVGFTACISFSDF